MDDIVIEPTLVEQPEAQPISEPMELAEKAEEELPAVKTKKRHLRLVCPMCGMSVAKRRFEVEHHFPNVMECHFKGRGKIEWLFVDESEDITREMAEAAQEKIAHLAITLLDDVHAEAVIEKLLERDFISG